MRNVHFGPLAGLVGQVALLVVVATEIGLSTPGWVAGLTCSLALTAVLSHGLNRSRRSGLGPADWVTLVRATLVVAVTALIADGLVQVPALAGLLALASVALALDAVDGWVARHTSTTSFFGARFDMEVDAFLILVLSVHVAWAGHPWVILIGAARYLFVLSGWLAPWMRATLPARYWRKPVAAVQGIALTLVAAELLRGLAADAALAVALVLLAESFGRDVWWLGRHRTVRQRQRELPQLVPAARSE